MTVILISYNILNIRQISFYALVVPSLRHIIVPECFRKMASEKVLTQSEIDARTVSAGEQLQVELNRQKRRSSSGN